MPILESAKELEKSIVCVEFALRRLEDVWHLEAALLSGATSLSEASDVMVLVKSMLVKIQLVLVAAAPAPAPCWKDDDDDDKQGVGAMKWITAVVDVCICIEKVVFNFSNEVARIIPISSLPEAVKRISTKPINLFALNRLAIEMKKIQSQLHNITNHDAIMFLTTHNHTDATLRAFPQHARPSPLPNIDETELVSYDNLQKSIIDKLLDPTIPQRLQVAILGPEAAGKTALAQKIYQSTLVKNHFDVCFWLFDMNRFDYQHPELIKSIDILRKMLITLEPENSSDCHDEKVVIQRIRESLKAKRYLVVIENVQRYDVFKKALPSENNGSRVLISSQEMGNYERVCLELDPEVKYQLPSLSYEERLKLIFRKPFEKKDSLEEYPSDLLPTARIIAASSWSDSPMNLLLLSGHILFNQPFSHNQVFGDIPSTATFSEILTSVYNKLPIVLRSCFAYMAALFPVNYLIHANSLIRLWIAEGMIPKEDGRTMEQTAELYLDELIQRGFVRIIWAYYHNQPNQSNRVFVIHPMLQSGLFNDYTGINNCPPIKVILGKDAAVKSGYYGEADGNRANLEYLRRLALHNSYEYDQFSSFQEGKTLHGLKYPNLHSLFFFGSVAPLMFSEFGFLRVLTVFQARIRFCEEDRSCWLEGLINLRYLGFIVCWVEGGASLGKKLSRLTNLRTLDLSESSVSGISEFMEHNTKVNVIGPIKEELHRCWSPVPDMTQLTCQP